uniref:YqaJ viral recombinase domain-containing protein n=1 Tax=Amblyomma maculatum TaxID=34609 RepID=G3MKD7_AMBMU
MQSLKPLSQDERHELCQQTIGQAANKKWFAARVGRLTASMFKRICRCTKPESLLKALLYPCSRATSEAIVYGRNHEADAVEAYARLLRARDCAVNLRETGLHIHHVYPFLAASPDRIIVIDEEEGLLEVKCPFSKKGLTTEEACQDRNFCCRLSEQGASLKTDHAYYYQVQGQMAITGHRWCDFVIWTEGSRPEDPAHLHVERIPFDEEFWTEEMLPALLYFMKRAFIPELLTKRVKRLGQLYTSGSYVSHSKLKRGYYVCRPSEGLRVKIKKLK